MQLKEEYVSGWVWDGIPLVPVVFQGFCHELV